MKTRFGDANKLFFARQPGVSGATSICIHWLSFMNWGEHMTKICKWGNSLGLRLPAPVALAAGLKGGARVGVRLLDNGSLLVTPQYGAAVVTEEQTLVKTMPPADKW